jgi:DNA topoisomerase-1
MKNLVIVESPAKAKTIEKYLGKDFKVLSSVGHIRKDTKVDVANDFAVTYEITPDHKKIVSDLKKAAKEADQVWLATDEDREGESISWHLIEVLKLPKNTNRITFHEITKTALEAAINAPRKVDMDMVASQQARQTLDMLIGYDLSGVVRRKVPGAISAGRVQSPALRLVVEREREIENFNAKSTFKVSGLFETAKKDELKADLPKPLKDEKEAQKLLEGLAKANYQVSDITTSPGTRTPAAPFTTASLQIEANSKLGFSAGTTMRAAQSLYQSGHITYMRTDSVNLSNDAISAISGYITSSFGEKYLKNRHYKTKSAGAQEAHEAIRPTHIENEAVGSNDFERKIYNLIRSRTLATQMSDAKLEKTVVTITTDTLKDTIFEAKGEVIIFDGFLKVYGRFKEAELPKLQSGDPLAALQITARETFSKPPARYTEGSLVKKLEELGIGRPSTYAGILGSIQARGYVKKGESEGKDRQIIELTLEKSKITRATPTEKTGSEKGKLVPEPIGELVSDFLIEYFNDVVDYGFTAGIETELDQIAEAKLQKLKVLQDFYTPFSKLIGSSSNIERYNSANALGIDPKTGKNIYAKIGKNGGFIQLGENEKESGEKPRFAPLPAGVNVKNVTFEQALEQLELPSLPRSLGTTKDGTELIAAAGPFGPYLKAGKYNIQLNKLDPYTVDFAAAEQLYKDKLASIIADWGDVSIINGAYGPYVKGPGRLNNAKIPKDTDPKTLTKEDAEKLLSERSATRPRRSPKSSRRRKTK